MKEINRVVIPAKGVRSLCWHGDALIDWLNGNLHNLDGTSRPSSINWAPCFDRAVISPDGRFAVIYEALGTKGLVLKNGVLVREINRSFYYASAYEYPVVLFALPDGRNLLAHCPEKYNKLEIEDAETGECLTQRSSETVDFFQSRLRVSSDGKHLMSAGWIWNPLDYVLLYDTERILAEPALLDARPDWSLVAAGTEIPNAAFAENGTAVFVGADAYYDEDDQDEAEKNAFVLRPGQIGRYSLSEKRLLTIAPIEEPLGTLMPVEEYVVGFYEHPKLVEVATGDIIARWPELKTRKQSSSIGGLSQLPPIALDAPNRRFAVADGEQITVIQLG